MLKSLILWVFKIGRLLFWTGLWLFGLGLWIWYPLRWWPGDTLSLVRLLNYFMPWLLVGLIPAMAVAGLARRKRLLLILALPVLVIALSYAPLFFPRSRFVLAHSNSIKVMSYNLWQLNRNVPAAVAVIREQQPDILLLQELSPYMALEFKKQLTNLYSGQELHFAYNPGTAQGIITHYPLTPLEGTPHAGRALKVRVETPDGSIQIWNVHLSQPFYWPRHADQIESLAQAASDINEPLILGGDFNTTDQSEMYRVLSQHLGNAHWEAGWGFGFSYPSSQRTLKGIGSIPIPLIRIDHLFHNDHLFVRKAGTLSEAGGSDHLPIVAEFVLVK